MVCLCIAGLCTWLIKFITSPGTVTQLQLHQVVDVRLGSFQSGAHTKQQAVQLYCDTHKVRACVPTRVVK